MGTSQLLYFIGMFIESKDTSQTDAYTQFTDSSTTERHRVSCYLMKPVLVRSQVHEPLVMPDGTRPAVCVSASGGVTNRWPGSLRLSARMCLLSGQIKCLVKSYKVFLHDFAGGAALINLVAKLLHKAHETLIHQLCSPITLTPQSTLCPLISR
jgi:hypothetical protein